MENIISKIYIKFGINSFTTSIVYQLNDIDQNVTKIINIIEYIQSTLNVKYNVNLNLENLIMLFIYIYHSNKVIFDLPCMLDNIKQHNGSLSTHNMYNETISQLISVGLMSETFIVLNDLYKSLNIMNIELKTQFLSILLDNRDYFNPNIFIDYNKYKLNIFYENLLNSLFNKCIKLSVLCYNNLENLENDLNIFSTKFISNYNINE